MAELVREYLQRYEFLVELERRGDNAADRVRALNHEVLILDLNLPGWDGLDICRELRGEYAGPIAAQWH